MENRTDLEKPIILVEGKNTLKELTQLKKAKEIVKISDIYELQLRELFEINNPKLVNTDDYSKLLSAFILKRKKCIKNQFRGNWLYFPWNRILMHTVNEKEYFQIRTNRNRNLITKDEQDRLYDYCIGILGLSVGSHIAITLAYNGIASSIKLAEFDSLETSNLNRMRASIDQIGMPKIDIVSHQIYGIDPYINLFKYRKGVTKEILEDFINSDPKPNILFEIIDNFEMKILLRKAAKKYKIPVVMVTNLGDRLLIDIERYDREGQVEIFNGRTNKVSDKILEYPDVTEEHKHKYVVELTGVQHIPKRALDSVDQIGKTLVGRPQLASTVTIAAGICAYVARKIALNSNLPSQSCLIDLDKVLADTQILDN